MTLSLRDDAWLSEQLGEAAYHLEVDGTPDVDAIRATIGGLPQGPVFVDVRLPVTAGEAVSRLVGEGFVLVDTAVSFEMPRRADIEPIGRLRVRHATSDDEQATRDLAETCFRYSRFHVDPLIPSHVADALKAAWVLNYFRGRRGDAMIVAESKQGVVGFLQLLVDDPLVIDLLGVAQAARRMGAATDMIAFALDHVRPDGASTFVGTQLANTGSIRLYERLGFRLRGAEHVLHLHQGRRG